MAFYYYYYTAHCSPVNVILPNSRTIDGYPPSVKTGQQLYILPSENFLSSALHCHPCLTHCSPGTVPNPTPGPSMSTPLIKSGQPSMYTALRFKCRHSPPTHDGYIEISRKSDVLVGYSFAPAGGMLFGVSGLLLLLLLLVGYCSTTFPHLLRLWPARRSE